jgi:hypothetical protein
LLEAAAFDIATCLIELIDDEYQALHSQITLRRLSRAAKTMDSPRPVRLMGRPSWLARTADRGQQACSPLPFEASLGDATTKRQIER